MWFGEAQKAELEWDSAEPLLVFELSQIMVSFYTKKLQVFLGLFVSSFSWSICVKCGHNKYLLYNTSDSHGNSDVQFYKQQAPKDKVYSFRFFIQQITHSSRNFAFANVKGPIITLRNLKAASQKDHKTYWPGFKCYSTAVYSAQNAVGSGWAILKKRKQW